MTDNEKRLLFKIVIEILQTLYRVHYGDMGEEALSNKFALWELEHIMKGVEYWLEDQ